MTTMFQVILVAIAATHFGYCDYYTPPLTCDTPMTESDYNSLFTGAKMNLLYVVADKNFDGDDDCVRFQFYAIEQQGPIPPAQITYQRKGRPQSVKSTIYYTPIRKLIQWDSYPPRTEYLNVVAKQSEGVTTITQCHNSIKMTNCKKRTSLKCNPASFLSKCTDQKWDECTERAEHKPLNYFVTCKVNNCNTDVMKRATAQARGLANKFKLKVYSIDRTGC